MDVYEELLNISLEDLQVWKLLRKQMNQPHGVDFWRTLNCVVSSMREWNVKMCFYQLIWKSQQTGVKRLKCFKDWNKQILGAFLLTLCCFFAACYPSITNTNASVELLLVGDDRTYEAFYFCIHNYPPPFSTQIKIFSPKKLIWYLLYRRQTEFNRDQHHVTLELNVQNVEVRWFQCSTCK